MGYCSVILIHPFLEESHGCCAGICMTPLRGVSSYNSSRRVDSQDGLVVRVHVHSILYIAHGRLSGDIHCGSNNHFLNSLATIYSIIVDKYECALTCGWPRLCNLICVYIDGKCIYLALRDASGDCPGVISHAHTVFNTNRTCLVQIFGC